MFLLLTAFAAGAALVPAQRADLPELFVAACLDGGGGLSAAQAATASFQDLPLNLQERLGSPVSGRVWKLNAPGRAYLYILNYEPRRGVNPKICGLASDTMDLNAAADAMEARIAGKVSPSRLRGTEWLKPQDGYTALATTADEFSVVQVNWLSKEQRAEALESIRILAQ